MNILWLSHLVPYPPKGGVLQRSYNLLRELCRHHDITLVAFIQTDLIKTMYPSVSVGLADAERKLGEFCRDILFLDIPNNKNYLGQYRLALTSLLKQRSYTMSWLLSDEIRALLEEINNGSVDFDVVHFDTISLAPYYDCFPDIPKLLNHHNIESNMMMRRSNIESNILKRIYYRLEGRQIEKEEKQFCCQFDMNIACSDVDVKRLKTIDDTLNVRCIPNGVDTEYFVSKNPEQSGLVFAGGLDWYPNRDAMLFFANEVWPLLKVKYPNLTIDVIGANPPAELIKLSKKDVNYRLRGFVDDVRPYIDKAAIYVCPIRDGGGTKLKLLDAFAMKKATIAHPTACEGIDVVDGDNVIMATTPEQYFYEISLLIHDESKRKKLGNSARELVLKKYSFSMIGKKLTDIYNTIS